MTKTAQQTPVQRDVKAQSTFLQSYDAPAGQPKAVRLGTKIHLTLVLAARKNGCTVADIQGALMAYDAAKTGKGKPSPVDLAYARTWLNKSWVADGHGYGMTFAHNADNLLVATLVYPTGINTVRLMASDKRVAKPLADVYAAYGVPLPASNIATDAPATVATATTAPTAAKGKAKGKKAKK